MALAARQIIPSPNPIEQLKQLLQTEVSAVDRLITSNLETNVPLIAQLAKHLIFAGGKRIRPLLTLSAHRLLNGSDSKVYSLASAVEFIHTATLLHDDVVDDSDLRRGNPTANVLWGNNASILVGDFLFARSFQLMVEGGGADVLEVLANTSAHITEGEVLQLTKAHDVSISLEDLLKIMECKTAELFSAACQVGAMAASGAEDALLIKTYGHALGMIFQIIDDILDYQGEAGSLGKSVGDDFGESKITLPVYFAFKQAGSDEKLFWQRTMGECDQKSGDFEQAVYYLTQARAFEQCLALAHNYGNQARAALARLPNHPIREILYELIDYCIERES